MRTRICSHPEGDSDALYVAAVQLVEHGWDVQDSFAVAKIRKLIHLKIKWEKQYDLKEQKII